MQLPADICGNLVIPVCRTVTLDCSLRKQLAYPGLVRQRRGSRYRRLARAKKKSETKVSGDIYKSAKTQTFLSAKKQLRK